MQIDPQRRELLEFGWKLLEAAPDPMVVVDQSGRIVLINAQAEQVFGYDRDELVGQEIELLIPDRFRTSHVGQREGYFASPKIRLMGNGLELYGRKRDGTEFPVEVSLSPLVTAEGRWVSASVRDVTERKKSEQEVRRIQEHLLSAVESIQGAFAIFDKRDRLVLCNSTYRQAVGTEIPGEIVGRQAREIYEASITGGELDLEGESPATLLERFMAYHQNPVGAMELRASDGRRLRKVNRRTLDGGAVVLVEDVTEHFEREAELLRAREQAESANLAKSEFLSSMSHELRTPLNAILGFAQLLQRDRKEPLSERHRERIQHVIKGGEHLLHLIDDVLDLSRIETGHVLISAEPFGLAEVLDEVKSTLDPMAERAGIDLVVSPLPRKTPELFGDRTRFKQVLMNFGSNAIKYGRQGGSATLVTDLLGTRVRVTVRDDGIGIPADKQSRVFEPFHRAGQETGPIEGTGIGLSISKKLAELMGGCVGFRSSEGAGSEFWVEMPSHQLDDANNSPSGPPTSTKSSAVDRTEGPRHLIVYVEDNPSNIAFMRDLISDFPGVELITAISAEIGIELVRARQPKVVIMDINLPGMSGLEATQRLRTWPETRDIPVVALSAAAMVRDKARVNEAGFYRYLTKPVRVDELAAVLEELLPE